VIPAGKEDSALRIFEELNAKREGFIIFTLQKKKSSYSQGKTR